MSQFELIWASEVVEEESISPVKKKRFSLRVRKDFESVLN